MAAAFQDLKGNGFRFLQVKTVAEGYFEACDRTSLFYKSLGFREFEIIPELWHPSIPCQIDVMAF
mgnify:FL=1